MIDGLNNLLIPIFPNLNDNSIAPTANKAGNGSHLIKSFNDLIVKLDTNSANSWKLIEDNYTVNDGDKLLHVRVDNTANTALILPTEPIPGYTVSLISVIGYVSFTNLIKINTVDTTYVALISLNTPIDLIYVNNIYGWICTNQTILEIVVPNSQPPS